MSDFTVCNEANCKLKQECEECGVRKIAIETDAELRTLKQERDEFAAQVEVMRDALAINRENLRACQAAIHLSGDFDPLYVIDAKAAMKAADSALSITGPDALAEIQARTLPDKCKCPFCNGSKTTPFVRSGSSQHCNECDNDGMIKTSKIIKLELTGFCPELAAAKRKGE